MERTERNFYYDKGNYLWKLKPQLESRYFTPKMIIQFGLVLPFFIPLPDKSELFNEVSVDKVCYFMFSEVKEKRCVYIGSYQNDGTQVEVKRTRVEVTFAFKDRKALSDKKEFELINDVFDQSLHLLNNVIQSYVVKTKDDKVHRLTKEYFDFALLVRISNGNNYQELNTSLFTLHMQVPDTTKRPLTFEEADEIMKFVSVVSQNVNPFITVNEILIEGKRSFNLGNYKQAIINAQTSVEVFMYLIYREFLKQEGLAINEVNSKSEKMRFKSLVVDQITQRIGGDFNVDNPKSRVGKWWRNTYLFRNKVVHEGYYPSFEECDNAIYYATDVMEYVLELINTEENKGKYAEIRNFVVLPYV